MAIRIFPTTNDIGTYPGEGRVLSESALAKIFNDVYPGRPVNGFSLPNSSTTLSLTITPGRAIISGYWVYIDTDSTVTCTANSINYIWLALTRDTLGNVTGANFIVETTGTQPTDSILIGIAVTDSSTVMSTQEVFYEYTPYYHLPSLYCFPYWGVVMRDATTADGLKGTVVSGTPTYLTINPGLIKINDKYYYITNPQKFIIDTSTTRTDAVILRYYLNLEVPVIIYKKGPYTLTQDNTIWETEIGKVFVGSSGVSFIDLRPLITDFKYPSLLVANTISGYSLINNLTSGTIQNNLGSLVSVQTNSITLYKYGFYHIDFFAYADSNITDFYTEIVVNDSLNHLYTYASPARTRNGARVSTVIKKQTDFPYTLQFYVYPATAVSYYIIISPFKLY